jgi:O-methyltransferase
MNKNQANVFRSLVTRVHIKHKKLFWRYLRKWLSKRKIIILREMDSLGRERTIKLENIPYVNLDFVRLSSLELVAQEIKNKELKGAVAELGVYCGVFASYINQVFPNKKLYLFDTFTGFDERDLNYEKGLGVNSVYQDFNLDNYINEVMQRMPHKEACIIKKGYFPESLNGLEETFSFVSIDCDLYKPILAGLEYFYPRLEKGGYIFVHDFNYSWYPGARKAVCEYCEENKIGYFPLSDHGGSAVICK